MRRLGRTRWAKMDKRRPGHRGQGWGGQRKIRAKEFRFLPKSPEI